MDVVDPQNAAGIIMQETERMTGLVEESFQFQKLIHDILSLTL